MIMSDLISRQVLDLWNKYKPTIAVDAIEYDRELRQLLGTNLAEVGTDCISRQEAIDALYSVDEYNSRSVKAIKQLPPIQPKRGRWVLVCDNNGMHFICNKCGAWRYHQEQKFCGECGSDMREVNHESN